jgi:endoglucanase
LRKNFALYLIVTILIVGLSLFAISNLLARNQQPTGQGSTSSSSQLTTMNYRSLSIRVSGNELVNASGKPVHLVGVNIIAGACVPRPHDSNLSILFDGGLSNSAVAQAIFQWHANVVRITPNEDCWLGINGVNASVSGINYRNEIQNFVYTLNSYGIYVIIDLHASAPGSYIAIGEQPMADQDHSITYWESVATMFKNDSAVIFEPYNEPHITTSNAETKNPWQCWLDGCNITIVQGYDGQNRVNNTSWQAAGMQELVNTIRSTGATNPILLGGLNWSQNLTGLQSYLPNDPQHQLIANYHNYEGPLNNENYWNTVIASVAQQMPVITTEFGENDCGTSFVSEYMSWADSHNISYLPWAWTNWDCSAYGLLSNWNGSPSAYGQVFYNHFQQVNP